MIFHIHPVGFFILTLTVFSIAALFGLRLRTSLKAGNHIEAEEMSVRTLLGASLGLFGVLLGFTFSMANSRFEERSELEVTEGSDLQVLWFRTSFLLEPARSQERSLLRQYVPVRIEFFDARPEGPVYWETLRQSAILQRRMWEAGDAELQTHNDVKTLRFMEALGDSITVTERRASAAENRIPAISWIILVLLGMMACVLLGVDLKSHSYFLRGLLQVAMAAALTLTYDIDTPRKGFVQVSQQSLVRTAAMMNAEK